MKLLISGNNFPKERATFAQKVLDNENNDTVPSLAGEKTGHIDFFAHQYIDNHSPAIEKNYFQRIKDTIDNNEHVTYVVIQGLSNLASFLEYHPEYIDKFDVLHMGMTTRGAEEYIGGGTNMEADPAATRYVYNSGLERMRVVGSHTTINDSIRVHPETDLYKKLQTSTSKNHKMLFRHLQDYHARRGIWPALHDPLACSVALGEDFVSFKEITASFNESGQYKLGGNVQIVISEDQIKNPERFMQMMTETL